MNSDIKKILVGFLALLLSPVILPVAFIVIIIIGGVAWSYELGTIILKELE